MTSQKDIAALLASQGGQFSPIRKRGYLWPIGKDGKGKTRPAVPQFVYDIAEAMMAPGRVLKDPGLMITLGSGAIPAEANSLRMGIKAYHGSPHDFDRFDMSKIGTGEGAQAYGHGLYFAGNENVAKSYRDNLTGDIVAPARRALTKANNDPDTAIAAARSEIDRLRALNLTPETGADRAQSMIETQMQNIKALEAYKQTGDWQAGRMYEVNIDANPDDFLDYDAPLSKQSPKVRSVAEDELRRYYGNQFDGQVGNTSRRPLGELLDEADRNEIRKADRLREAGIPGIKYLDAGSRGAGDGSRNYVVFDDKLISIVKKYGVAALVSAGVLSQAQGEEMKAQGYN
jgi:hypothetical protein